MRIAVRQADSSGDGGEEQEGANTQNGQQSEQQGSSGDSRQVSASDSSSSSSINADQDRGQDSNDSDNSAASGGSTDSSSTSSNQDSSSDPSSVESPGSSTSSGDTSDSGSQGEQGASSQESSSSSSISTPTTNPSQDDPSPPYTSEPTSTTDYTMDQSATASSDNDNAPSETTSSSTTSDETARTTETFSSPSDTSSPTDVTSSEETLTSDPTPTGESDTTTSETGSSTSVDVPSSSSTTSTSEDSSPSSNPSETSGSSTITTTESIAQDPSSSFLTVTSTSSSSALAASATVTIADIASTAVPDQSTVTADSSGSNMALSVSSSSNVALGDQVASSSASNGLRPSSSGLEGASITDSNDNNDGNSNSKNKDPFLNGGGEGGSQNGRMIGGTVGGIIAAIVIVVVIVWLLGKRRRQKFVKPIVERMHASGSGYSLPSMLNGPGSGSGSAGMTPSTTANSLQGILAASRRRSRAFSIESASTYDKVDLQTEANQTPNAMHASFPHEGAEMMQVGPSNLMTMSSAESHFLPVGAAPYPYRALHDHAGKVRINEVANTGTGSYAHNGRYGASSVAGASSLRVKPTKYHQQIPSGSSFGSNYMLDQSAAHAEDGQEGYEAAYTGMSSALNTSSPSGSSRYAPQAQLQSTGFYQDQRNASPTQELLTPSLVKSNSNYSVGSPFDDDEDNGAMNPMPHSPTMVPTLLQRRTTDPFSNKHSLRVINVDHDREPGTPTETTDELTDVIATPRPRGNQQQNSEESRPFSNWSSIAPSRASTGTMSDAYSTFHFDSFGGFSNGGGRTSRADSLDAGRRLRLDPPSNYKRSSSSLEFVTREGEILTPRQVSDVGFFKNI